VIEVCSALGCDSATGDRDHCAGDGAGNRTGEAKSAAIGQAP
jgi:hypothetical protein